MKPPRKPQCSEDPRFPVRPHNRPALPHIGYRIGTYAGARRAMLAALDRDPTLAGWTHREADDPGIALLEAGAIVTDVLTFYQELYANEAFLRTASWRESIADLVKLTGYRLTPALGGKARFALQARGERPVVVPAGFGLKADLAQVPDTASFETDETATAYPWASSFHLFAPLDRRDCRPGSKALRGPGHIVLQEGDKLLLGDAGSGGALVGGEIVVVDQVRRHHGETMFTVVGELRRSGWLVSRTLRACKLGRSFKHFGHNAPPQEVTSTGSGVTVKNTQYLRPFDGPTRGDFPADTTVQPNLRAHQFPLETTVEDLPPGSRVVLRAEYQLAVFELVLAWNFRRTVTAAMSAGVRWGGLSAATTLLALDSPVDLAGLAWANPCLDTRADVIDIRRLQIHEVLAEFDVAAQGVPTATPRGRQVYFFGTREQAALLHHRPLAFVPPDGEAFLRTPVAIGEPSADSPLMVPLILDAEVDYRDLDHDAPTVTVYGNLVTASEGKTQREAVLGSGDARASFQTFRLPKAPLTYHLETGAQVHVWVGGREWQHVKAFYGHGPDAEVFVIRQDAAGESWIQFGDGVTGARLPTGLNNVSAVWRAGAGSFGPMKPDTDPSPAGRIEGLRGLKLPGVVTGGAPRESGEHARATAPGRLQSLDRLVSLTDFVSEALALGGVVQARADWELIGGVPGIVVSVLMAAGREGEAEAVRAALAHLNRCRGPQRAPLVVRQARFEYVFLDASVAVDPRARRDDVLAAVEQALRGEQGLFAAGGRPLGQPEYVSRVEGVIQNVSGVAWTAVTGFGSLGVAVDPATLVLPPAPRPLHAQLSAAADRTFRLEARDLALAVAASPPGACHE